MKPCVGKYVWLPCEVKPGAFSDERMVLVQSDFGEWLGFVPVTSLKQPVLRGDSLIAALVVNVNCQEFSVKLPGESLNNNSFFKDLISRVQTFDSL